MYTIIHKKLSVDQGWVMKGYKSEDKQFGWEAVEEEELVEDKSVVRWLK